MSHLPGGEIEPGESPRAAAVREMWEETGCAIQLTGFLGEFISPRERVRYYIGRILDGGAGLHDDRDGSGPVQVRPLSLNEARALLSGFDRAALDLLPRVALQEAYDPDQARDEHGRWTSGGGATEPEQRTDQIVRAARFNWNTATLKDLEQMVNQVRFHGGKADLCRIEPPICYGNLGIARAEMPQFPKEKLAGLVEHLKRIGVKMEPDQAPVRSLRATQDEIDGVRVLDIATHYDPIRAAQSAPMLVSEDGYVLDGHHRWAAHWLTHPKEPIEFVRVELPIRALLAVAERFSGPRAAFGEARAALAEVDFDPEQHPRAPAGSPEGGQFVQGGDVAASLAKSVEPVKDIALPADWKTPNWSSNHSASAEKSLQDWLGEKKFPAQAGIALAESLWQALPDEMRTDATMSLHVSLYHNSANIMVQVDDGYEGGEEETDNFSSWDDVAGAGREGEAYDYWARNNRDEFIQSERENWWESENSQREALLHVVDHDILNEVIREALTDNGVTEASIDAFGKAQASARGRGGGELLYWVLPTPDWGSSHSEGPWGKYGPEYEDTSHLLPATLFDKIQFEKPEDLNNFEPGEKWPPYSTELPDPNQYNLPIWDAPPDVNAAKEAFAEKIHDEVVAKLYEKAKEMHENQEFDAPADDYFAESVDEYMKDYWDQKSDQEKWRETRDHFEDENSDRNHSESEGHTASLDLTLAASDVGPNQPASLVAHVSGMYLRPDVQGKGIATRLIGTIGHMAQQLGIKTVSFTAASSGSGSMVGAYVWAKLGFSPANAAQWSGINRDFQTFVRSRGSGAVPEHDLTPQQMAMYVDPKNHNALGKDFLTRSITWEANVASLPQIS